MKHKRYILTLSLIERDRLNERESKPLHIKMFYRTTSEGHARLMFDQAISCLSANQLNLDHDPISQGEERLPNETHTAG